MPEVAIVIPCYNEEHRLQREDVLSLLSHEGVHLVLVDDGSRDKTLDLLHAVRSTSPERIDVLGLGINQGKAEAVRQGLLHALKRQAMAVGYLDADLSTPPDEFLRLIRTLVDRDVAVVLGARIRLLGTHIRRRPLRHYLGRVFASFASLALRLGVYDTQCGAKVFRASAALHSALEQPFSSRWVFDVELIARLLRPPAPVPGTAVADFIEVPLHAWRDVAGSKLGFRQMLRSGLDLFRLAIRLRANPSPRSDRLDLDSDAPRTGRRPS